MRSSVSCPSRARRPTATTIAPALAKAISPYADLHADERFADAESRAQHDDELIAALTTVFATKTKLEWEHELSAQDVGCV